MSDSSTPCLSFIGIVDFTQEAAWKYISDSVYDILGYEPSELLGQPSINLVHPEESRHVQVLHRDTINADKAAALVYIRMKHKDPFRGYVLCGVYHFANACHYVTTKADICRTIVHNVVVGSVSFAYPGGKTLKNVSTAREVTVLSPAARGLKYGRWDEPLPHSLSYALPPMDEVSYSRLPSQSFRTALFLDRFTLRCDVLYCSNDLLIDSFDCLGRSFFDYVAKKDEVEVREYIDTVKSWGVNETGQPSDGGFGYSGFTLLTQPRTSKCVENAKASKRGRKHPRSAREKLAGGPNYARPARKDACAKPDQPEDMKEVDAIFSAHSDGIIVILRQGTKSFAR